MRSGLCLRRPQPWRASSACPPRIRGLGHRRLHVSASLLFRDSQGSAKLRSEGAENRSCRLRRAASRVTGPVVANALSRHQSVTKTHEPGSPGWGVSVCPEWGTGRCTGPRPRGCLSARSRAGGRRPFHSSRIWLLSVKSGLSSDSLPSPSSPRPARGGDSGRPSSAWQRQPVPRERGK